MIHVKTNDSQLVRIKVIWTLYFVYFCTLFSGITYVEHYSPLIVTGDFFALTPIATFLMLATLCCPLLATLWLLPEFFGLFKSVSIDEKGVEAGRDTPIIFCSWSDLKAVRIRRKGGKIQVIHLKFARGRTVVSVFLLNRVDLGAVASMVKEHSPSEVVFKDLNFLKLPITSKEWLFHFLVSAPAMVVIFELFFLLANEMSKGWVTDIISVAIFPLVSIFIFVATIDGIRSLLYNRSGVLFPERRFFENHLTPTITRSIAIFKIVLGCSLLVPMLFVFILSLLMRLI